jgi:hypothetical protein
VIELRQERRENKTRKSFRQGETRERKFLGLGGSKEGSERREEKSQAETGAEKSAAGTVSSAGTSHAPSTVLQCAQNMQ